MELTDLWNLRIASPSWQPHKIVPPPRKQGFLPNLSDWVVHPYVRDPSTLRAMLTEMDLSQPVHCMRCDESSGAREWLQNGRVQGECEACEIDGIPTPACPKCDKNMEGMYCDCSRHPDDFDHEQDIRDYDWLERGHGHPRGGSLWLSSDSLAPAGAVATPTVSTIDWPLDDKHPAVVDEFADYNGNKRYNFFVSPKMWKENKPEIAKGFEDLITTQTRDDNDTIFSLNGRVLRRASDGTPLTHTMQQFNSVGTHHGVIPYEPEGEGHLPVKCEECGSNFTYCGTDPHRRAEGTHWSDENANISDSCRNCGNRNINFLTIQ